MPYATDIRPRISLLLIALLGSSLVLGCQSSDTGLKRKPTAAPAPITSTPPAPTQTQQAEAKTTQETATRTEVRQFSPDEQAVVVDASEVSLKQIFEDLGPDAAMWYQHVLTLSNPYFEGRGPGSIGIERAADYLEFYFQQYGLQPAFEDGMSYRQAFDFPAPTPTVELHEAALDINNETFVLDEDFIVLGNSAAGDLTAEVAFVGYSIEEGPDAYSSFDEDDELDGKVALMLRYEPLDEDGKSRWSNDRFSSNAAIARKMRAAADRGAAAILLVNPPGAVDGRTGLESYETTARWGRRLDIPTMQISPDTANTLLMAGDPQGRSLETWRTLADTGQITATDLDGKLLVTVVADLDVESDIRTDNIGAVLPGHGDLADEWIIVGGHYDHVGFGYTGTMPGNVGKLHPGGDDNASGTAGILLAADRLTEAYAAMDDDIAARSILFLAFSAEEAGLYGSRYYVDNPTLETDDVTLMFNLDMIGRLRDDALTVYGTGTAQEFDELLTPHFQDSGLDIEKSPGGRGPSDHSNFYSAGIPVLFTFTGTHDIYHTPMDFGYTVNPAGAIAVLDLMEAIVLEVATQAEPLTFMTNDSGRGGRRGARVRLGIMPSYSADLETGVLVEWVRPDAPAQAAGILDGDIIASWNGQEVTDGRRLFELLAESKPGDEVQIGVLRDGSEMTLNVTLEAQNQDG